MRTTVIRIGNSRGVRIPKALLDQCRLKDEVELEPQEDGLLIRPVARPRAGWDSAFQEMAERRDDTLLDREAHRPTEWDKTEWEW